MKQLNREVLLAAMTQHETLTIDDIAKVENIGFVPDAEQLRLLLRELTAKGELVQLPDVMPATFTITNKGILSDTDLQKKANGL